MLVIYRRLFYFSSFCQFQMKNVPNTIKLLLVLILLFYKVQSAKLFISKPNAAQYNRSQSYINAVFSSLAYCDRATIQNWTCRGAKQVPFRDPVYLYDNLTQAAGFIGYQPDTKTIVLSYRGSSNKRNWQEDFNFETVRYPRCKDCWIHAGFYFDYSVLSLKMYENIDQLLAKYQVTRFVATGHSLGGSLALIAGTQVKMNYGNKFNVEVHTFGQPRVGEVNLAQFMKQKIDAVFRVVHNRDIVPHVPFEWLKYVHVPTEILFSEDMSSYKVCNDSGEDPSCSNKFYPEYSHTDHDFYFLDIDGKTNCKLSVEEIQ